MLIPMIVKIEESLGTLIIRLIFFLRFFSAMMP